MNENISNNSFFIVKLFRGEYSLAKTYWLYSALPVTIFGKIISYITSLTIFFPLFFLLVTYHTIAIFGIWRAANKYDGWKVWSFLAKFMCVVAFVFNILWSMFFLSLSDELWISKIGNLYANSDTGLSETGNDVNVLKPKMQNFDKDIKSYEDCIIYYTDNGLVDSYSQAEIKCDEFFPVVDIKTDYTEDMFEFSWYSDFWNIYLTIDNINTSFPIHGISTVLTGSNSSGESDPEPVDVYFPVSGNNNTSSVMTLHDTSLLHFLDIKKVHYKGRALKE